MTDKLKYIFIAFAAMLILSGCEYDNPTGEDVDGAGYVLAGYYMMAGEEDAIDDDSRATAPTWWDDYKTLKFSEVVAKGTDGIKINNYPEQGQKTYITMTSADTDNDVYLVSARTEYPNRQDVIDYYLEEYYLQDSTGDDSGNWYDNGIIVDDDWEADPKYRVKMEVHFQDGSIRYEWISETSNDMGGAYYSHFDLDGDMTIPTDEDWEPETTTSGMQWSSKVYYYHSVKEKIKWFRVENKEIFGVRYYTEDTNSDSSSLAYETMISQTTLQSWVNRSSWIGNIVEWLFGRGDNSSDKTLSETVIRYELNGNSNKKTTRAYSEIVTSFGNTITFDLETEY